MATISAHNTLTWKICKDGEQHHEKAVYDQDSGIFFFPLAVRWLRTTVYKTLTWEDSLPTAE